MCLESAAGPSPKLLTSPEIIYLGQDNTIDWQLQADGAAVGNAFCWTSGVPATGVANLFLTLGGETITAEETNARLTVYDPDHVAGLVWTQEPVAVVV